MRDISLDLDDSLDIKSFDVDVAVGVARLDGEYVRLVHVLAARQYTVPLDLKVETEDVMKFAAALIRWDTRMMEQADDPLQGRGATPSAKSTLRSFQQ